MNKILLLFTIFLIPAAPATTPAAGITTDASTSRIEKEVRHELLMLPYYTIFDNLAFRLDGDNVTLMGSVTRPVLKDDAERAVKKIEGVERVQNQIHVLPLSPLDDRIRAAAFRAIYGTPALNRYAHQSIPPIHIIVENGRITLEGVVASKMDSTLAYTKALGVHDVFSVTNNLTIEQR
jgi:hyperosmotically inducible protein